MDDLETRRRRALYRATHRGTKEMDWPDPDLQHWILDGGDIGSTELAPLIGRIRTFHGIANPKDGA
jgi:succinate dehydrogenase flavin-adding protein (antitoxin of CptAB toxin-antitoxin module)